MQRYTVDEAKTWMHDDLRAMRAEYTKMRDIAQKRILRMQTVFPEAEASQKKYDTGKVDEKGNPIYKSGFPTLKLLDSRDLPKAFSELSKFVTSKRSSISGQREIMNKTIKAWNDQGIPLNKQNYDRTMKILERMRQLKIVYDSETAAEVAQLTLALSDQQFDQVLDNLEAYLLHVDELSNFMDSSRDPQTGYEKVDMSDFTDLIGW